MVVCAMAGRLCAGTLVGRRAAAGGGALDRSTDNRGADLAPITGMGPRQAVSETVSIRTVEPDLA